VEKKIELEFLFPRKEAVEFWRHTGSNVINFWGEKESKDEEIFGYQSRSLLHKELP